jgi:hypothetical protein
MARAAAKTVKKAAPKAKAKAKAPAKRKTKVVASVKRAGAARRKAKKGGPSLGMTALSSGFRLFGHRRKPVAECVPNHRQK